MGIDLRHLRCFQAVAEELHFRRAAERLGIAQPALSRTIQNLEEELGVTLFDRSNRLVRITKAGETFLRGSRSVLNGFEQSVEATRRVHLGKSGSLRVGYTDFAIAGDLPDHLRLFKDRQPDISLHLRHAVTTDQLRMLEAGDLDFGFLTGTINRDGYAQCTVQSERFVCVVYDGHPLARRKSIRLQELANEDFVHGSTRDWEYFFSYMIPMCRRAGFEPRIVQEGLNSAAILGLVACGMGITILTDWVCGVVGPGLRIIPLRDVTDRLDTNAVWRTDTMHGVKQRFADFLQAQTHRIAAQ